MESSDDQPKDTAPHPVRITYALAVMLIWAVVSIVYRQSMLGDPDIWWHIRTGGWMLENRAFPTTDPFSFTFAGKPWIAKEWLSQLLFYGAFRAAGWNGVIVLAAAGVALGAGAIYWSLSRWLNPLYALAIAVTGLALASPALSARPHVLTLWIVVVWTDQLFTAAWKGRAPSWWLLGLLVLWANLHAAFTFGIVIAGFACLDVLARSGLSRPDLLWRWGLFLVLCLLVSLIHPYGWHAILATWSVAGPNEAVPLIDEWQPFSASRSRPQELGLLVLLFSALASGFRLGVARTLLLVLLLHMLLNHIRFVFLFFTLVPVIVAPDLVQQFPRLSARAWLARPRDVLERRLTASFRPIAAGLAGLLALLGVVQAVVLATVPPPRSAITGAMTFVKLRGITGRVFNDYAFGGPLIFHGIETFIDGRTDQLFLGGFTKEFTWGPRTAWRLEDALRRYDIAWTLLPPSDPRVALLNRMSGWQRVYADAYAVIHVPRGSWKH